MARRSVTASLSPNRSRSAATPKPDGFIAFVLDPLADLRGLTCRAMFGGYGIIHKEHLYFKTHPTTVHRFRAGQMKPLKPTHGQTLKNYYEVPLDILESAEVLAQWALQCARP